MNSIFTGSYTTRGRTYDYSGIWTRRGGRTNWKAIVRNTEVVSRPCGQIDEELADPDVLRVIRSVIEADIEQQKAG